MNPWDEIKREYLSGKTPKQLCEKYPDLKYSTLTKRITQNGWKKEKDIIFQKIGEKTADLEAEAIHKMRQKEREDTDILIDAILSRLTIKIDDKVHINPELDAQDVKSLSGAYKDIQQIKYKSFGISDKLDIGHKIDKDIDFEIVD